MKNEKLSFYGKKSLEDKKNLFIERANSIHNNFYDYSKFIYTDTHTHGIVICPIHGEFPVNPNRHLSGKTGCPDCGIKKSQKDNQKRIEDAKKNFVNKARSIFGDKYDYSKFVYVKNHVISIIICPVHGEFAKTPNKHTNSKQGCPHCTKESSLSKGEREILNYLLENEINFNQEYKIENQYLKNKPFDFYLPDYNVLIEFDGEQHYKTKFSMSKEDLEERIKIDKQKELLANKLGYNILRIKYNENIKDSLQKYLECSTTIESYKSIRA
jgi:very-short-patch-repair endonuclease